MYAVIYILEPSSEGLQYTLLLKDESILISWAVVVDFVQPGFGNLQGLRLHSLSGHLVPMVAFL